MELERMAKASLTKLRNVTTPHVSRATILGT